MLRLSWLHMALLFAAAAGARAQERATTLPAAASPSTGQVIEGIVVNHLGAGIAGAIVRIESVDASEEDPPLASTTTGRTGDIRIELPRRIEATVRARIVKEGFATLVQELDLTDESQPPWIDATLEGAATLTGVVRDRLFNEPVKGAQVACETGGQGLQTSTDAQGRYRFNTVAYGPVAIRVSAKGFAVEQASIQVLSDEAEADFELGPERKVELTLVTDDGKPATDVRVEGLPRPGDGYVTATTDPDGRVSLGGIGEDAEEVLLRFNGPRYVQMRGFEARIELRPPPRGEETGLPTSMPAVRQRLTVQVAGRMKGTVVDAKTGEPIVGVRVIAGREYRSDAPMDWTALDGTYELTGVAPGPTIISYQHGQYATAVREVEIDQDTEPTVDVRLEPGLTVAGVVVDRNGEPVEKVFVSGDEWQGHSTLGLRGITDENGAFSFPNAPAGQIHFSFVKPGYGPPIQQMLEGGKSDYRVVLEVDEPDAPDTDAPPPPPRRPKVELWKIVPDMTLMALDGTVYRLSELRGKYVFLDIWATWCGPCMAEVEHVKGLRQAFRSRADFVLIGVSLDTDRDALRTAVQQHAIDWPQVFGPKSGAREAFEMLSGVSIPYTGLIGPEGRLLAQDLRGAGLVEAVKAAMSKPPSSKPAAP